MTTGVFERRGDLAKKTRIALGIALNMAISVSKARTAPVRQHFQQHAYTWAGFGCISGASFVHSVFTGLIVTGILLLVFEWKVGE